jgi:hypothetical protein
VISVFSEDCSSLQFCAAGEPVARVCCEQQSSVWVCVCNDISLQKALFGKDCVAICTDGKPRHLHTRNTGSDRSIAKVSKFMSSAT